MVVLQKTNKNVWVSLQSKEILVVLSEIINFNFISQDSRQLTFAHIEILSIKICFFEQFNKPINQSIMRRTFQLSALVLGLKQTTSFFTSLH